MTTPPGNASNHDIRLVTVLALLAGALCLLSGPAPWLSTLPGLALVLLLPGYAWVQALAASVPLSAVERGFLTVGASIGAAVLTGLVLTLTPTGLTRPSWAAALGAVTVAGGLAAVRRRGRRGRPAPSDWSRPPTRAAVTLLAAGLLAAAAGWVALVSETHQPRPGSVALWLVPQTPTDVTVGVTNGGDVSLDARVTVSGAAMLDEPVSLQPGATWRRTLPAAEGSAVRASLTAARSSTPLRTVVLHPAGR